MKYFGGLLICLILCACGSTAVNDGPAEPAVTEVRLQNDNPAAPAAKPAVTSELSRAITSGNPERIKNASVEALTSNPKDETALNALAVYYYGRNQLGAAEVLLDKALAVNPRSETAYNTLGLIALAKDDVRGAVLKFRRATEINPRYYIAAANAAAIYAQEKDYNKVIFSLEPFVNDGQAGADALGNYGLALAATGKTGEAAAVYAKILAASPDNKNALLNYAILLIEKQEKYQEGLDLLNRLKFVGYDNESRPIINNLEVKAKAGLK